MNRGFHQRRIEISLIMEILFPTRPEDLGIYQTPHSKKHLQIVEKFNANREAFEGFATNGTA